MPTYDFECPECGSVVEKTVLYEERDTIQVGCLDCSRVMDRIHGMPSLRAVEFTPHFDEGLGVNVYSRQQRDAILRDRGWIEAGDTVGGARNFDAAAPHSVGRSPLKAGMDYEGKAKEDIAISIEHGDGSVENTTVNSLPVADSIGKKPDREAAKRAFDNLLPKE